MQNVAEREFSFGEFDVDASRRLLLKKGEPVNLNPKAFDLLLTLVENRGRVLTKNELLDKVWENQFVEENNLTVHVAALRKILGEKKGEHRFIVTVPGKGYKFVAELNDAASDEIIIENRSFSRIVVDEEIEETADAPEPKAIAVAAQQRKTSAFNKLKSYSAILFGAVLLAAAIGAGGYVWRNRQANFSSVVPFAGSNIKQLTTNGKVQLAALSPDGKLFAYVTSDLGQRSLWLGYVEGGNHLPLRAASDERYYDLAFSPDGSRVYFSLKNDRESALYKMPVSGGVQEKVLDAVENFSLSPNGRQIAVAERDEKEAKDSLFVVNLDNFERREIASFPKSHSFVFNTVSWSDDAAWLAFAADADGEIYRRDIAIANVSSGEIKQIRNDVWREVSQTAWLKDGGLIVAAISGNSWSSVPQHRIFHVEIPSGNSREITTDRSSYGSSLSASAASDLLLTIEHRQLNNVWVAPSDDLSAARQITFSSFGKYDGLWGMDWTPDGEIIYTNSDTQSQFISQMSADGGEQKPLTAPGAIDSVVSVTRDGRYIVFHSNRAGGFDIWRADIDGGNPLQLTFGKKNFQPFVSADSRSVYYKSWEKDVGELRRVSINGGEPEILNDKETSWGSFSPDGQRFAAVYKTDKNRLAVFSAETHEPVKQFDFPKSGTASMGLHWTPDSKAIVYRDFSYGYWMQRIEGGEPQRIEGLPKEKLYNFAWSKDGKQFAFVRGQEIRDVVLFRNGK